MTSELEVGSLPYDITKEELQTVFSTYGTVSHIAIRDNGVALVHYTSRDAASDAIEVLHNIYKIRLDAPSPITVAWAKEGGGSETRGGRNTSSNGGWSDSSQQATYTPRGSDGGGGSTGDGQQKGTGHKVFVGGLPDDISESELNHVFGTYGSVNHVVILKAQQTSGLRAALVFYDSKESGEDAIKVLNDIYKIRRDAVAPISVRWGMSKEEKKEQENKLFVGNLPHDITEQELRSVFETYGKVEKALVLAANTKSGDRAALVFYEERDAAEDAIGRLHEVYKIRVDAEHAIVVKWAHDKSKDSGGGQSWNSGGGAGWGSSGGDKGGYGGSGGWQGGGGGGWQDKRSDSSWKDNSWNSGGNNKSGGSDWSGKSWNDGGRNNSNNNWQDQRNDRKNSWNDGGYNNWQQDNSWSSRGGDRGSSWNDQGKGTGGGSRDYGGGKGSGYNNEVDDKSGRLHVSNLPEDITEDAMQYVFSNYGSVQKIHIMNQKVMKGCVAAFVEYNTPDDADTAIASLNDKYEIRSGYGPIVVKHARPRSKPY